MVGILASITLDSSSAGVVLAWVLLISCWLVIVASVGFVGLVLHAFGDELFPDIDFDSPRAAVAGVFRIGFHIVGLVLILIALFRSPWDASIINLAFADTAMKALALWPATAVSAVLTVLIVAVLPDSGRGRARRTLGVLGCLALSTGAMAWLFYLSARVDQQGGIATTIFFLGYGPLMLVSVLFLAAAVGVGFLAGITHPRAGGIRTVLFALGLVATIAGLHWYGPVPVPLTGAEPVTVAIVETGLGLWGTLALFVAGTLGIVIPTGSSETAS